jgi:hypothetical protein
MVIHIFKWLLHTHMNQFGYSVLLILILFLYGRAVKLLVEIRLKGDPNNQLKTPSDYLKADNDRMAAEKSRNKDILKDESPLIPSQIHDGEGIVVPTNYERQDDGNSKSV